MRVFVIGLSASMLIGACSAGETPTRSEFEIESNGSGGKSPEGGVIFDGSGGNGLTVDRVSDGLPTPGCGNGLLTDDEACDDGNQIDDDGCTANCLGIEPGYSCHPSGVPCHVIARCGDGIIASSEVCDDGNTADGDGCSSRCQLEIGHKCSGEPSVCQTTTCGDGKREGAEACDDGNAIPFDGCSATCQAEPSCPSGACTSACGDGLLLDEECDDGNDKDGDGCSADCRFEEGFSCTTNESCEKLDGKCILRVPVIYRDFSQEHSDFAVGCGELTSGIVQQTLSPEGKPQLANGSSACIQSASSFAEWYTDNDENATIVGELVLYENGQGGFVNRFGPNGEQWAGATTYSNVVYGGAGGGGCDQCTPSASGQCYDPCTPWGAGNTQACCAEETTEYFDGNPLFFPIDESPAALTDARFRAKIPEQYGFNGWPWEDSVFPTAGTHDFHFTTEVVYWFEYDASKSATLDFTGDDDVWVFVNGRLAVDLGGPHVPENGSVTIDSSSAGMFGLADGSVYEIRVFHAERKVEGSSFKLTLEGFNTSRTECEPICGDGIVTLGEECDDGENDGGYEECEPGCVLGARCGDGVVQEGEDCDDGNRFDGDTCGSACRRLVIK